MTLYRTLSLAAALSLATLAVQAAPQDTYGETYPAAQAISSTLTRAEVIAELVAARQAGTLPRTGDWSNAPASLALAPSTLTRAEVVAELVAARQAGTLPRTGDWSDAPAPLALAASTRSREEVRNDGMAASKAGRTATAGE